MREQFSMAHLKNLEWFHNKKIHDGRRKWSTHNFRFRQFYCVANNVTLTVKVQLTIWIIIVGVSIVVELRLLVYGRRLHRVND